MAGNFFDGPDDAAAPAPEQAAPQQDYAPPGAAQGASDQDIVNNENAARRKINEKNQPKNFFGDEDDAVAPEAPKAAPKEPRGDVGYWQGLQGEVGNFLTFLHKTAGQSGIGLAAAEDPTNTDIPAVQSEWHTRMVDPIAQEALKHALPEDATGFEKLRYGLGSLTSMIAEAYLTGGASLSESVTGRVAEKLGAGTMLRRWAASAAGGSAFMLPGAIEHAATVGDQVYESTGDARASAVAATVAFGSTIGMGAMPFGARGSLTGWKGAVAGATTAFAAGAGSEEAQRVAENASKPDALQENFSVENMLVAGAVATPLGLLPHATPHVEARENVNEMAQRHAAEIVREGGGDNLDAAVAATQVAAEVGGMHDAAAVHAAREEEAQQQQGAMEMRRAQAQAAAEADQADIDRGQQEQAAAEQKKAEEDAAYAEKAHQDQAAKDADFQAAKNQTADEEVESANAAETGTEKGGGNEPKPTLADALPPEQRSVLEQLKAQRAAEAAKPPEPAKEPDTTPEEGRSPAAETRQAQAEAEQQNEAGAAKVEAATAKPGGLPPEAEPQTLQERRLAAAAAEQETPPPVPQTLKERRAAETAAAKAAKETAAAKADSDFVPLEEPAKPAAEAPEEAQEPTEAEEPETPKPPAPTPETLAERRQQALDEARAAAERGERPAFPGESPAASEEAPAEAPASEEAPAGPLADVPMTLPEGSSRMQQAGRNIMRKVLEARKRNQEGVAAQAEPVKNRLAAIRAAAEKARAAKAAPTEGATAPEKGAKPTGFTPSTDEQLAKYAERAAAKKKKGDPALKAEETPGRDQAFHDLADAQRGKPETAMLRAQAAGSDTKPYHKSTNAWTYAMEHVGDMTHRMSEKFGYLKGQVENVAKKIRDGLRVSGNPVDRANIDKIPADHPVVKAGEQYAAEHAKLPVYNRAQELARDAAVALGRRDHDGVTRNLRELQKMIDDGTYHEEAGKYDPNYEQSGPKASASENDWFNESQRHVAEDMDRALNPRMSHDEAREHLAPVLDHFGPRQFRVDPSAKENTVGSPLLKQQISDWLADHPNGRLYGVYDPETGIAHVFADAHDAGDRQSLLETAIHELTHKGLPALLKEKYGPVMDQIYASVKDTKWARDLVARRKMDLRSIDNQRLVADEYAAHMSENILTGREVHEGLPVLDRNPDIKQRFFDAVRSVLRALGISKHWNDNDIARLVRQAHMGLGDPTNKVAREGAAYKGPRFSADENDARIDDLYAPDHPDAIGHKIGRTAEEQGKYNPGFVKDTERLLKDVAHGKPDVLLGAIGLRNIPDFIRQESMPNAHAFIDDHDAMEGRRRMILKPTIERAHDWSKFQASQPDRGEALTDLMHAFTLNGLSADKPYEERHTAAERAADPTKMTEEKTRREVNKFLQQKFNEQPPEARAIYKQVRDDYTDMRIKTLKGLEDRINATGADEQTKKNAMAALRKSFESGQVKGDYFPLQRFGDLWASASDKEGNHVAFSRHESQTARKEWLKAMRDQGFNVDQGERMDNKSEMERISPDFVKNIMAHVEAADPTGSLAKDVWQEYLKAMPEMSMRKHMITRVGRLGYSRDALRAYAFNMFHGAHQLARLEYGHKLDARLDGIKKEADALQTKAAQNPDDKLAQTEGKWAPAIAREMGQRYDWLRNPRASKLASNITKFGFSWYLGAAPATAFRIFSQNPMLAAPQLAKHFGWLGASKGSLGGQSMKWASKLGMRGYGDSFRGDERRAYDEADQRGVFSDTNTQMMASGGDGSPMFQGGWYQFQKYAGYMFNAMEHHNRATTLMAGYRLGRTQGMDHDSASRLARQITWDSHFDYTNANRPRYLQGDIPKVIGLFKQYSLGVTYRLAREGADMINSTEKTPQQRLAAAGALASLIGRMTLFAGATGIPGYWIAEKIVNAFMGDDDKPYDMTAAMHKTLSDSMGTTMADSIMTGPVGAISGASLSTGASYNDLWYKPNMRTEEPQQQVYDAMGQLMGPIGALPLNAALGGQQMAQGNIERGLEHFLPPEASALAKAVRYFREGALNTKGQNILPQGQSIDGRDVFLQSLGFTPQKVADAQRHNTVVRNLAKDITDRRELLSGRYESAILVGDQKTAAATWTKIQAFNKANPEAAIGPGLASGTIGLAKRNATSVQGIPQTPTTRKLEEKY